MKPCPHPGCAELVSRGWCAEHRPRGRTERPGGSRRGGNLGQRRRWQALRVRLVAGRRCAGWPEPGECMSIAEVLDHVVAVQDGGDEWDESNLQPLCRSCHSRKTNAEVRGRTW